MKTESMPAVRRWVQVNVDMHFFKALFTEGFEMTTRTVQGLPQDARFVRGWWDVKTE